MSIRELYKLRAELFKIQGFTMVEVNNVLNAVITIEGAEEIIIKRGLGEIQ